LKSPETHFVQTPFLSLFSQLKKKKYPLNCHIWVAREVAKFFMLLYHYQKKKNTHA